MSRQTLASGMLPLDAPTLARWVHDPQEIKPGCLMPAFGLNREKEALIVRYLLTLH
jgi:cytochrome c oxidase subunit 2